MILMARWDEILTLPVQNPPTLEFSATDIVWSRVEGWRETLDRLALIPFTRVNDFVRGESNNKDCPTKFHVEARRKRSPEMANKPKVDGILEYILYWCSFGPDDHRKGGVIRPSRNYSAKRKTPAGRPNTKRGCVCHFIVKRLIAEPSVALIIYNQDKHVDKKGLPCHGPQDKKAVGTYAMFAPCISDELRLQIMSLLYVGVPVETIMQRHTEVVEKQGGPSNRDDLLTHRYVRRLERKIRRSTFELDDNDIVSVSMWVENHRDHVFFYEDFSDSEPFVLGIQTDWQLQQMIQFGNRSIMASDFRFGTNKLKYPVYSLLVFDSKRNAIPVAWIITPSFASSEIHRWMRALYDRIHSKDPTWNLGGVIVDDPLADLNVIREVFQCSILVSFWRVRHSWHKNLINKCIDKEMQVEVSRRLGEIVSNICRGHASVDSFNDFVEDFVDCSDFLDYFKGVWFPKLGAWANILKALPLASTEISSAIECYHNQLKLRLLNENDLSIYQRADWLVDKLGSKVHSYYWLDEYSGKDNFARYWKDEWKCGLTSWRQALKIPDSDVVFDVNSARVVHRGNPEHVHVVINPGSEFAICDCSWSNMGNLCEHVIKSTKIFRDRRSNTLSTSMFEYNRTLMNVLHCPPHNSLMRDHAISLAVSVQAQLSALFCRETCISNRGTSGQAAGEPTITSNQEFVNANEALNENQGASLESTQVSQNVSLPYAENFGIAAQSRAGNGSTGDLMKHTDKSSADLMSAEEQISKANEGDSLDEKPNLLSEMPCSDSCACHISFARDGSQDDMLVDNNNHEVALHTASAEDVPVDITGKGDDLFSEKIKTAKQNSMECFQSAAEYKAIYGLVNDRCSSHLSDNSFIDANCVVDPIVSSHGSGYDVNSFAACATIMLEPSSDVSQASVVRFKSADVKACMDIDVTGSEEKVCDNGANQKRLIVN